VYATTPPAVKPARLPTLTCPHCGTVAVPTVGPGTVTHAGRALCSNPVCRRFLQWLGKAVLGGEKESPTMGCINKVFLLGTISKQGITVKYGPSGAPCATFTLVLSEQGQDGKVHTLFQDCEVWGKKAEAAGELEPGQLCLFEGKL